MRGKLKTERLIETIPDPYTKDDGSFGRKIEYVIDIEVEYQKGRNAASRGYYLALRPLGIEDRGNGVTGYLMSLCGPSARKLLVPAKAFSERKLDLIAASVRSDPGFLPLLDELKGKVLEGLREQAEKRAKEKAEYAAAKARRLAAVGGGA